MERIALGRFFVASAVRVELMRRRAVLVAALSTSGCLRLTGSTTENATRTDGRTGTTDAGTTVGTERPATATAEGDGETTTDSSRRPPTAWAQLGYDATNAGFVDAEPVARPVYVEWTRPFDGRTRYGPAVDSDTVYAADDAGTVAAFDAATGDVRWRASVDAGVTARPAIADETVYVAAGDRLRALAAADGRTVWRSPADAAVGGAEALTVSDGVVYVGARRAASAFDAATGDLRWEHVLETGPSGRATTPAVADGVVLTSYAGGDPERTRVRAIGATSGETAWEYAFDGGTSAESAVAVADGVAYAGSDGEAVAALDVADGTERWRRDLDAPPGASPTVGPERVFVATREAGTGEYPNRGVRALDRKTGETAWRSGSIPRLAIESASALVGESLYCVDYAGTVFALDRATGEARWQLTANAGSLTGPAVANGRVYAAGEGGVVAVGTRGDDG